MSLVFSTSDGVRCHVCGVTPGQEHEAACTYFKVVEAREAASLCCGMPAACMRACVHRGRYEQLRDDAIARQNGLNLDGSVRREAIPAGIGDVNSDARGSGARFNSGKPPVELIPVWIIADHFTSGACAEAHRILHALGEWQRGQANAMEVLAEFGGDWWSDCAAVFDYGRKKYAEWNWAKGMKWSVPLACAVRHCLAILRGEENDPESGLPHRGHVACNIVMLAQYESSYPEGDDRPWKLLQPAGKEAA